MWSIISLTRTSPKVQAHLRFELTLIWPIFSSIGFELGHSPWAPELMCCDLDELHFSFAHRSLSLPFHPWIDWYLGPLDLFPEDLILILHILLMKGAEILLKMQLWLLLTQ